MKGLVDNGYGTMVKPVCDQCGWPVAHVEGVPDLCQDEHCDKTLCGLCAIDGWDGEQTVLCQKHINGPTPAEIMADREKEGQMKLFTTEDKP